MRRATHYVFTTLLAWALAAPQRQVPLADQRGEGLVVEGDTRVDKDRPLHGRFLQVTDFHPDRFYQVYSSTSEEAACHRGQGPAGIYGAETSECDSPIALVNKTLNYIAKEFKDQIDFVIWTGDSARHDNDDDLPRSPAQVAELNEFMVQKMAEVFGKHNGDEEDDDPNNDFTIPIVPTLGNNDITPHNIFEKGPNRWTRSYASIWRQFIPEAQRHAFEQGGWFYTEVIPNKLAVFSLNTLYFFGSNAAADGCAAKSEPGYQQMEWLRIQLQFMRARGMKAILIGHVPPIRQEAKTQWDETCWQKYTLWTRQYRDVIVSSHYGHFNYDHFVLQDFGDIDDDTNDGRMKVSSTPWNDDDLSAQVKTDYWLQVREQFSELPEPPAELGGKKNSKKREKYLKKIGGEFAEHFSASFVSPSVVPNLFPSLRIYEYNTTGLEEADLDLRTIQSPAPFHMDDGGYEETTKKKSKKYKFTVPEPPAKSTPPGPAYSPQTLSLLKYTQYYANLTEINNDFTAEADTRRDDIDSTKWHEGKHKGKKPHEKDHTPNPRKFQFNVYYDTQDDPVYHLPDLTMRSLLDLATRIGNFVPEKSLDDNGEETAAVRAKKGKKHQKTNEAWYTFIRRVFMDTMDADELNDEFGH